MKTIPAHPGNYRPGRSQDIAYLVIHYTGNNGDTAENNGNYFKNNVVKASAHYFVDEQEIVQSVADGDTAWHCGSDQYVHPACRNGNAIGIELCSRQDADGRYDFLPQTLSHAAALASALMQTYSIPETHVLRHFDVTGKHCPAPFVEDEDRWIRWRAQLTSTPAPSAPSAWAREAAQWAERQALIRGDEHGDPHWQDPVTREELAVILYRYHNAK